MTRPDALSIRIDRLALTGFSRAQAVRIERAFRDEIARLTLDAVPAASDSLRLSLPTAARTPEDIGAGAARALFRGLAP